MIQRRAAVPAPQYSTRRPRLRLRARARAGVHARNDALIDTPPTLGQVAYNKGVLESFETDHVFWK